MNLPVLTNGIQVALRAAIGAGLAVIVAQFCNLEYPVYALIAAVIVTDFSPSQTRTLGLQRLVATVVGASCGAIFRSLLQPSVWAVAVGILIAMCLCHLTPARNGAKVAGYICGIVIISYGSHPWSYAFFRLIETVLGISIAWLISFVPKLVRVSNQQPSHRSGRLPFRRRP